MMSEETREHLETLNRKLAKAENKAAKARIALFTQAGKARDEGATTEELREVLAVTYP